MEKDREEEEIVMINFRLDVDDSYFQMKRDCVRRVGQTLPRMCSNGKRLAVTVSGLHHAGTALAAAHPSDRGVHPGAPSRRGHARHIRGLAVVL